jgi:tetratricopeptide (TPR) repeat protein
MLEEIIHITPEPLPDQEAFMSAWIEQLRRQKERDADAWLREAIRLAQGVAGLAELAQREGRQRPHAYLDWVSALVQQGAHRQALQAAQHALDALPAGLPLRAAIADQLYLAATALKQPKMAQESRWQAFLAKPELERLVQLWEATPKLAARTERMRQAADHLKQVLKNQSRASLDWEWDALERSAWVEPSLLAHAYLLSQQWEAAYHLAAAAQVLGWSSRSSHQSLVVACLLMVLAQKTPATLPLQLGRCWQAALAATLSVSWHDASRTSDIIDALNRLYDERLTEAGLSVKQQQTFLRGCLDIARRRIDSIVSQQHRRSYDKAAQLAYACAETLQALDDTDTTRQWLAEIRSAYPRHRAFQAELDAAGRARH